MSRVCHNVRDPITDVCVKCRGGNGIGLENKAYASRLWHNDRDPIADFCVKFWGKSSIGREKKSYVSLVWPNYRDPIAGFFLRNENEKGKPFEQDGYRQGFLLARGYLRSGH